MSTATTSNEKSWSETIRAIEASKKTLPWRPEEVVPVEKVGLLEVIYYVSTYYIG